MNKWTKIFFLLYFYLAWFGCARLGKANDSMLSLFLPLGSFLFILKYRLHSNQILIRSFYLSLFGLSFDVFSTYSGLVSFSSGPMPIWLISLWFLFFCYLPQLADFFIRKYLLAFVFGSIFGPLSYLYGEKIKILIFSSNISHIVYSIFWGCYFSFSIFYLNSKRTKV